MGLQHEEWECRLRSPTGSVSTWTFISDQPGGSTVKLLMVDQTPLGDEIGATTDLLKTNRGWIWQMPSPLPSEITERPKINFLLDRGSSGLRAHVLDSSSNQERLVLSGKCAITRVDSPFP